MGRVIFFCSSFTIYFRFNFSRSLFLFDHFILVSNQLFEIQPNLWLFLFCVDTNLFCYQWTDQQLLMLNWLKKLKKEKQSSFTTHTKHSLLQLQDVMLCSYAVGNKVETSTSLLHHCYYFFHLLDGQYNLCFFCFRTLIYGVSAPNPKCPPVNGFIRGEMIVYAIEITQESENKCTVTYCR